MALSEQMKALARIERELEKLDDTGLRHAAAMAEARLLRGNSKAPDPTTGTTAIGARHLG